MKTPPTPLLEGEERIAPWEVRLIRQGSPEVISVPDGERIRRALAAEDAETASSYLSIVRQQYIFIVSGGLEWSVRWPLVVSARASAEAARETHGTAFAAWSAAAQKDEAFEVLRTVLDPGAAETGSLRDWESAVEAGPTATYAEIGAAIAGRDFAAARDRFEHYLVQARRRHDLLLRYIWIYGATVRDALGQSVAEECLAESFHGTSFYGPMWKIGERLTQAEIAAILAEHLRAHFSGAGRDGGVEVVEEEDRYRLLMKPCGSGGAIRQDPAVARDASFGLFREASPSTWMRTDGVPAYCAHCAQNEIESMARLGYPAWVTEFDPDPHKPCCWTVFKDPEAIPEEFFKRIGFVKDLAKFRKR